MTKGARNILIFVAFVALLGLSFAVTLATWPILAVIPAVIGGYAGYRFAREWGSKR